MAKERRDNKNRILSKGEYQNKDGRYMYRYTDVTGDVRYVYSWTLNASDRTPKGKSMGPSLRELEKSIAKDLNDGINSHIGKNRTLNDYFEIYMDQKKKLKQTTRQKYRYAYDHYVRDSLGKRKIADIKYSDIKKFYVDLVGDGGERMATVLGINVVLVPVFKVAVNDDCIRKNPALGVANEVKKEVGYRAMPKKALTTQQQAALVQYVKSHKFYKRWHPLILFLLGTGCRIGEALALTWDDCDFANNMISINKSIHYFPDEITGKWKTLISPPKTEAGIREIPMFSEVREILLELKKRQMKFGFCTSVVDGVSGFVFYGRDHTVILPRNFTFALERIVESYNDKEIQTAEESYRDPVLIPKFSPHVFRHTFCTRLCENGMNLKVVQEIMGHADISITMNIYNDLTDEFKKSAFIEMDRVYKIG